MSFSDHSFALLPLVAPLGLLLAAAGALLAPGMRPRGLLLATEAAALLALVVALGSAALLVMQGPATASLLGAGVPGLGVRLDAVSAAMLVMASFMGWAVLRYSARYLDGEAAQGAFMGWLAATLAMVLLLVVAGDLVQLVLAWIGTGIGLGRLLRFYPARPQAIRAARKMVLMARIGDGLLVGAAILLARAYSTIDIAAINEAARAGQDGGGAPVAALVLMALAAVFKSAQFPVHGWLTEVMEAPTPVSALLHAGVINAGGFVLIRFADLVLLSPGVMAMLVMIGGITALLGGLAMLAQSAVKTSLAWSTIAQMGFMIMQCGLGLFALALLHIVAHSLYKAHAFLASGTAVEVVAKVRRPGPVAVPRGRAVVLAFILSLAIYAGIGLALGFAEESAQAIALGAILVFGIAYLLAQGLADAAPRVLTIRTSIYSAAAGLSYFLLHWGAEWLTAGTLPDAPAPGPLEWALLALVVASFGKVAIAQTLFPLWAQHPAAAGLRVHLANGLYANAALDRLLGGWAARPRD